MKVALTVWNGRIAPVFDVAGQLLIVDEEQDLKNGIECVMAETECLPARVTRLKRLGAEALICGAISRPARMLAESQGIRIYGFISGSLEDVFTAWRNHELGRKDFAMPGCARRHHCCRRRKLKM